MMSLDRAPMTIRFPASLLSEAKETKETRESLNDFIVGAVDREVRRRRALQAHATILGVREQIRQRTGSQPDPVELVRELREGAQRRD